MGGIVDSIFGTNGSTDALKKFKPASVFTPGYDINVKKKKVNLQRTDELSNTLRDLGLSFRNYGNEVGDLRPLVEPGFGRLTEAAKANIESQRRRTVSDLRENLSRRRLLGSSFAGDAIARTDAEFAQQKNQAEAQSFLAELDTTLNLINKQHQAYQQEFATALNQSNFEAGLAAQLATGVTTAMASNAQALATLETDVGGRFAELAGIVGGVATASLLAPTPAATTGGGAA